MYKLRGRTSYELKIENMEDIIYKAIQIKTPLDEPEIMGLYDTSYGQMLWDGKRWHDTKPDQYLHGLANKVFYYYKRMTKREYLNSI